MALLLFIANAELWSSLLIIAFWFIITVMLILVVASQPTKGGIIMASALGVSFYVTREIWMEAWTIIGYFLASRGVWLIG